MEPNNKYNLEEKSKARKIFRKFGPIILIVGILITVISIATFFEGDMSSPFLPFISFPMMFIGAVMSMLGYMGDMSRYSASQTAPVVKDVTNYILDNTKESIGGVAKEISENLHSSSTVKFCPVCKEETNDFAKFCDHCGTALYKKCQVCNAENDIDAEYCQACGHKLVD